MRLTTRTTLTMLVVAAVPLALAGWSSIRLSEQALRQRARELHETVAQGLAERVDDALVARTTAVQSAAATLRFDTLDPDATRGALRLIFRQVDGASAVALFDADDAQVGSTQFLSAPVPDDPVLADRPALTAADIDAFGRHLPLGAARQVGASSSTPYFGSDGVPRLTLVARGHGGYLVAVELSLHDLQRTVTNRRVGPRGRAIVTDSKGRLLLGEERSATGEDVLSASATVPSLLWTVTVTEPEEDALAAATALTRQTLGWLLVALLFAAALGLILARAIVRPIRLLNEGASALRGGDLDHRIGGTERGDELGDLARTFNTMADEIQRWNDELEARVEGKTRELREAQELLVRSQKLAAVGELGAGVAHEINNPLAGILGVTQLALLEAPEGSKLRKRLQDVHHEGLRISKIVSNLQRLTSEPEEKMGRVELISVLEGTLSLLEGQLTQQGIEVVREYQPDIPEIRGDENQLSEAFFHLVTNAQAAMPEGGVLTLGIDSPDWQLVSVRISDTGTGIPSELLGRIFEPFFTARRRQKSKGLGLTIVSKIVDDHDGRIVVDSTFGSGSTFTVVLPAFQVRSMEL